MQLANRAMADEVQHAELAFALAGRYGNADVGPAPMRLHDAKIASDLRAMLVSLVEEACAGETVGVAEALASATTVTDPAVKQVLTRIADDELRHAELAWRTLRWGLERADADTRIAVEAALHKAMHALSDHVPSRTTAHPEHGLLSGIQLAAVRRQALREVAEPCAAAAFRQLP